MAGSKVHSNCPYTNPIDIKIQLSKKSKSSISLKRSARTSAGCFNIAFFCGTWYCARSLGCSCVKTDSFTKTILECCDSRLDNCSFVVKGRIECYCGGLMLQTVCITIHSCSGYSWSGLDIPLQFRGDPEAKCKKSGRPKNQDHEQAFSKMYTYLEINDEELCS